MKEDTVEKKKVATCALSCGELAAQVNVGEACEDEGLFFDIFVSFFHRYFIIVDDAIGGAVCIRDIGIDDIGRFLACFRGLVVEHFVSREVKACVFSLFDIL